MLLTSVLRCLSGVVVFVVLARAFGVEDFGTFMYAFTLSALIVIIVDYGFTLQLVRDIPREPERVKQIVWNAFCVKLVLAILVIFGVTATTIFISPYGDLSILLITLTLAATAGSFGLLFNLPFRALGKFQEETKVVSVANLLHFLIVLLLATLGYGTVEIAIGFLVSRVLYLLLSWHAYRRVVGGIESRSIGFGKLLLLLRKGLPFGVHVAMGTIYFQVDTLLIHNFLGARGVGIYQAPMRIIVGGLMLFDVLANVYLPRLARASKAKSELVRIGRQMNRYLAVLGAAGAGAMIAFGGQVIQIVYGSGYEAAIQLMAPLAVVFFLRHFGVSYGAMLTIGDRQGVRAAGVTVALIVNFVLNILLIPKHGLQGAVISAIFTNMALSIIYAGFAWRYVRSFIADHSTTLLVIWFAVGASTMLVFQESAARMQVPFGLSMIVLCLAAVFRGIRQDGLPVRSKDMSDPT